MSLLQVLIGETKGEVIARGTLVTGTAGWLEQLPEVLPEIVYCTVGLVGAVATIWTFIINRRNKLIERKKTLLEMEIMRVQNGIADPKSLKDGP